MKTRFYGAVVILAIGLFAAGVFSCHRRSRVPGRITFQEVILARQAEGMKKLIGTMRDSSLIPSDQALIIVDQDLVHHLLLAAIPFERDMGNGVTFKVTGATVAFEDGLALIQLDGRARLGDRQDVFTDITVYGDLNAVEFDREKELLRGRVNVIAIDETRVSIAGLNPSIKQLIEDISDLGLADLSNLNYTVDIPVRLAREVRLPAIGQPGEEIYIPRASVPLQVAVENVRSFRRKLWVTISLGVSATANRGESS